MTLLERDDLLAQLAAQWTLACAEGGRLVLVAGEAGIGKTSLLRAFAQQLGGAAPAAPVWRGACEALQTPRPLGALEDIAHSAGPAGEPLMALLDADGRRDRLFVAFLELLRQRPTLVVLEDLHWADGATLDLLRYVGRRIEHTPSLLVASYRTDELMPGHPLRTVLGDLATSRPLSLTPLPLSPEAVRALCQGSDADALELHRRTGGNPFFVTEVLAAPAADVPATVQDAVLARAGRLSPSARAVLDAAAIAGPRVEPWMLESLVAAESAAIEEGLATGVLCADAGAITFRHELARQAVLHAMPPTRAMSLHRMAQGALLAKALPHTLSRLALHAEGAGDADSVRQWAPLAAREAAARGAHLQAAQHWARALAHTEGDAARAALLDAQAHELRASGLFDLAIVARQQAAMAWRELGDVRRAVRSFTDLSKLHLLASRPGVAQQALQAARAVLPASAADDERAWVDLGEADLRRHTLDHADALRLGLPVLALAERHADRALHLEALKTVGAALIGCGRGDEGIAHLERGFAIAEATRADLPAAAMLSDLALGCASLLRLRDAEVYLRRGVDWCAEKDLDAPRLFQVAVRAWLHLLRGRWEDAEADAREVIDNPRAMAIARVRAHTVLARLQARRGDPGSAESLAHARRLGGDGVGSALSARLAATECAWLEGRDEQAAREANAGLPLARDKRLAGPTADLLMWLRLAGSTTAVESTAVDALLPADHPAAAEAAGRWQEAASTWRALGCPFETARALGQGDEAAQREALAIAESLGARPLAERLRQRLHAAGVRGLPRGPRAATQRHPAGLTAKEVAVLKLLAAGMRNKEIAVRLSRSPRTIEHHLESIFTKLDVGTRAEAVSAALRLGVAAAS